MNLNELIQQLQDLKESGKEIGRLPVEFRRLKKTNKSIDRVKVYADASQNAGRDRIELISLD